MASSFLRICIGSHGAFGKGSWNFLRLSKSFSAGATRRSPIPRAYLRAISAACRKSSSLLDISFGTACVAIRHLPTGQYFKEATLRPRRRGCAGILMPGFRLKDCKGKERAELSAYFLMTASSEAILPSRIKIIRCACCAMSCSWVTRIIVLPCR